eukprot:Seg23877.1 transcript_id=Seg23877.1/GoldUCD/mRNA.D3Y31 product="hypothetical protein" protein_id=Seg23877.1/GoldUCD/D3Y31
MEDAGVRIVFLALGAFAGMRPSEIEGVIGERDGLLWEDIDFKQRHIHIRPGVEGKLSEPRYITFTEKATSGLSKELADKMWNALCNWIKPYRKKSGAVCPRKCQSLTSTELRKAKVIEKWAKDGFALSSKVTLIHLNFSREFVARKLASY